MVYPIFNGKEVFYLPVLNRSLEYYISTLESLNFKINNIKHISTQGIDSEEFERVYNNPENPHFPEILSIPSTSQIVVSKK